MGGRAPGWVANVRTVKTSSGVTAVQIVWSSRKGSRKIEHLKLERRCVAADSGRASSLAAQGEHPFGLLAPFRARDGGWHRRLGLQCRGVGPPCGINQGIRDGRWVRGSRVRGTRDRLPARPTESDRAGPQGLIRRTLQEVLFSAPWHVNTPVRCGAPQRATAPSNSPGSRL